MKNVEKTKRQKELLTKYQAAALLEVSSKTIYNMRKEGILEPVKFGRRLRYKTSDLLKLKKEGNGK